MGGVISDTARPTTKAMLLDVLRGEGFAQPSPRPMFPTHLACCPSSRFGRLAGAAVGAAQGGMNLQSSTQKTTTQGSLSMFSKRPRFALSELP
jgi:hypothetical protein